MNYVIEPCDPAVLAAPSSWFVYLDMFNVWRRCLTFDLQLLNHLYSEYLFKQCDKYRDKVTYSILSYTHYQTCGFMTQREIISELCKQKINQYEKYLSANPNITMHTVMRHQDFSWDYDQLHCFAATDDDCYSSIKECLIKSRFWRRRYGRWSDCLKEEAEEEDLLKLRNLCFNHRLDVQYFVENMHQFQHLLTSEFFNAFCQNPNVPWSFLKSRVAYDSTIPLSKRLVTLTNPHVRWPDVLYFCTVNEFTSARWTTKDNNAYNVDYTKLLKFANIEVITAIFQKSDVPEATAGSLIRQHDEYNEFDSYVHIVCESHYLLRLCENSDDELTDDCKPSDLYGLLGHCEDSPRKCSMKKNEINPLRLNINLRDELKFRFISDREWHAYENSKSSIRDRRCHPPPAHPTEDDHAEERQGYSKNVNLCFKDLDDSTKLLLDSVLFQNPMPLEKVAFLNNILTPAVIKIQRWYRYRKNGGALFYSQGYQFSE